MLVAGQNSLDKQHKPRSDCLKQSDQGVTDKHFVNSNRDTGNNLI